MKTNLNFNPQLDILNGVNKLADAVATTLGPRGRNVAIAKIDPQGKIYARDVIHDGVGVAKSIDLENEDENMGAQILREAAQKTVDEVGDGTTATIVLAQSILQEAIQMTSTGINPMALRSGLEDGVRRLTSEMGKYAIPIKGLKDEIKIATVSAESEELGKLVGETLHKVGVDGVVSIEESHDLETTVEYREGLQIDHGYMHHLFITNPEEMEATLQNPYILITDKEIPGLGDLEQLLNEISKKSGKLVIISPAIHGEALALFIQNKLNGVLQSLCIAAPSFGQYQKNILHDIAILTGARYITEDAAHLLKDIKLEDLGRADYVTATKNETIIVGGKGKAENIKSLVKALKNAMDKETSDYDLEKLRERYSKLTNGVAVINVGGYTEIEMKEKKERVDDAVHATRAAMKAGIVPGGEIIYLNARGILNDSVTDRILYKALERPFRKLVENGGEDSGKLLATVEQVKDENLGYDVVKGGFSNMIENGIVDPLLVPQNALQNAVSVAIQLITTGCTITPINDVKK